VLTLEPRDGTSRSSASPTRCRTTDGNPLAQLVPDPDPDDPGEYGYDVTGEPYEDLEGMPQVDALCPLRCARSGASTSRGATSVDRARVVPHAEQVERALRRHVRARSLSSRRRAGPGYLERMLFGTGYFGAARRSRVAASTTTDARARGLRPRLTMWEKPIPATRRRRRTRSRRRPLARRRAGVEEGALGFARPFATECAGPIRRVASSTSRPAVRLDAAREDGAAAEAAQPDRGADRRAHQPLHDPVLLVHELAGIDDDEWVARPGDGDHARLQRPGPAGEWLAPPPLSADVWKHKADVREQLFVIGSMHGQSVAAPTANASGELVEQLRFNADRPLAPLTRSLAIAMADVAEDVLAILPTIWTEEKIIAYAGRTTSCAR
jgi:hypothetical protein